MARVLENNRKVNKLCDHIFLLKKNLNNPAPEFDRYKKLNKSRNFIQAFIALFLKKSVKALLRTTEEVSFA